MSILQPRRLALALLATVAAAPALAGGFAQPVVTPVVTPVAVTPVVVAPSGEWTGGFAGVQLGYGDVDINDAGGGDLGFDLGGTGALVGVNTGYNRDFGRFVLGGEVQYDRASIGIDADDDGVDVDSGLEVTSVFRAGVRAGYDAGRFLPYVTGGYASAEIEEDVLGDDATATGGYVGFGADYQLTERFVLGAQVLRHNFEELDADISGDLDVDIDVSTVSLRATYNF